MNHRILPLVLIIVLACGYCGAYTLEDFTAAKDALAKPQTAPAGLDAMKKMAGDDVFAGEHPEEAALASM